MNTDYFEIRVYNRSAAKKAFYSSTAPGHPVLGGRFDLKRDHGCGTLTLNLARRQMSGEIAQGYLIEVWSKPSGGALTRYYMGTVIGTPAAGTTANEVQIEATGLWYQVERQTVSKFYEGDDIDTIVEAILDDIDNDSDLSTSTTEISLASAYTLGDFEAEYMSAADALKLLAEVQGDVQYGVDQDGKLYFKDLSTTGNAHFWVGKHMQRFEPREYSDGAINRLYMQSRKMVGGGFLNLTRDQTTGDHSITNLGLRDDVQQIPHLSDPDDVWRWGGNVLSDNGIKTVCDAKPSGFSEFMFPRGNARITDLEATEYSLPIQKVTYRIDPVKGIIGEVQVGDEPVPTIEDQIQRIMREISTSKSNAIGLTKIEHTRGEEWQQSAIIDGQELGLLNHFTAAFTDVKTVDEDIIAATGTVHTQFDNKRNFVTGSLPDNTWDWAQYWSEIVPTGQAVDSVRAHVDFDLYGRVTFDYDEDLSDFFTEVAASGSGSNWRVAESQPYLDYDWPQGYTNYLWYTGPTGFSWPASYKLGVGFLDWVAGVSAGYVYLYWDWQDASNWNAIRLHNYSGLMRYRMLNNSGGSVTNIGSVTEFTDLYSADCQIVLTARNAPSTTQLDVYRAGSLQGSITSTTAPSTAANKAGFSPWAIDVTDIACNIDYFEIQEYGTTAPKITFSFSRDDGTTLSGLDLTQGTSNYTQSVSGQPSGTDMRMRARVYWPARLYGWGFSF